MLGIMLIDMQEGCTIKEKENLVAAQIKLLNYAAQKDIPVFTLEYIGERKTISELQEPLSKVNNHFIEKYNDNAFIKLTDKYIKSDLRKGSKDYVLFGDEWQENPPENKKLKKLLNKNKIKQIILTGIYKDACIFKTAKGAKKRGYEIFTSDELMEPHKLEFGWYPENSNHYKTLDELIKKIESLNIN
jgi:nicotinamidase-related amidase